MRKFLAIALLLSSGLALRAEDAKKFTPEDLQGTWLFESVPTGKGGERIGMAWTSKLVVTKGNFAIENFFDLKKSLKGTIQLDSNGQAGHVDLAMEEFDLKEVWPLSIPKAVVPAIYKFDGTRLDVAFFQGVDKPRPKTFDDKGDLYHLILVKAPVKFSDFPKEIAVKVVTADGKPAEGVSVVSHFGNYRNPKEPEKKEWLLSNELKSDAAGIVRIPYAGDGFRGQPMIAWDRAKKLMGIGFLNPVLAATKTEIAIELQPQVQVNLNLVCDELKAANKSDWFHCYAESKNGMRLAFNSDKSGKFEFPLPAGDYKLNIYGTEFLGTKNVSITVPKDRSEYTVPEIKVPPSGLLAILNKPAPELTDIVGWKGEPVKLADLKGKVVLLEFWGYWCGPCIGSMPLMFDLHEKFADKGLVIIGVHVDADGEVDTVKKLDEKLADFKKDIWKGKDLPFPTLLTSGKLTTDDENRSRGKMAEKYGIRGYPSTILIDREGKVVGKFHASDSKNAFEEMEKLLKAEKK